MQPKQFKISPCYLLCFLLINAIPLQAQHQCGNRTVTITKKDITLEELFTVIRKQTRLDACYDPSLLNNRERVDVDFTQEPLDNILAFLLRKKGLTWVYHDKNRFVIKIKRKEDPELGKLPEQKGFEITGWVTDIKGIPLSNAAVIVKGRRQGTYTDNTGKFALPDIKPGTVIVISSMGYTSQERQILNTDTLHIRLAIAITGLDEVLVIAYGTTTRRNLTGSVNEVNAAELVEQPVSDPLLAMEGLVPGLNIIPSSGLPNAGVTVELRGRNSIAAGSNPLYIIDGTPFPGPPLTINNMPTKENTIGTPGVTSPLNMINISDIASINVLKDADATAIYGSRGANGVILITTKTARPGQLNTEANIYTGVAAMEYRTHLLNTSQYLQMRREAFKNDQAFPHVFDYDILNWDTTRYTDWQTVLLGQSARITNGQLAFSGGGPLMQARVSTGFRKEGTVYPGNFNYQKASCLASLNMLSDNKRIKLTVNANYVTDWNYLPLVDIASFIMLPPNAPPLYNNAGGINWEYGTFDNPAAGFLKAYKAQTHNLMSNAVLHYNITDSLQLKAVAGFCLLNANEIQSYPFRAFNLAYNTSGFSIFANGNSKSISIEPHVTYKRKLASGQMEVLIGATLQQEVRSQEKLWGTGYNNDAALENITAATAINKLGESYYDYRYSALFGRINYNVLEKYIINLTGRRDGSSRFGPGRQFANFGAVGAAWIFSKEPWAENTFPFLSFGKLRASYGRTGNDQIADYGYYPTYSPSSPYQGFSGLTPTRLYNPNYSWELSNKAEAGIELGFWHDQVFLNITCYRNHSSNQLVQYPLSGLSGFNNITNNYPAVVQNTGWEMELNTAAVKCNHLSWTSGFNISIPANKLLAFPDISSTPYDNTFAVGHPLNILKGLHYMGVDSRTGIYRFKDVDGDGNIMALTADYTAIKQIGTIFHGGWHNSLRYKSLQLDMLLQFVKQDQYNYLYKYIMPGMLSNQPAEVLNRWRQPGDYSNIQLFSQASFDANTAYLNIQQSDAAIADASYIRLKNLSISYQLPDRWLKRMRLQNARFYLQGQNLFTLTGYKGLDPEVAGRQEVYPTLRICTIGLQLAI